MFSTPTTGPTLVWATFWAFVPFVPAALALRPVSQHELTRFARRYAVSVGPDDAGILATALVRIRGGRLVGAALGLSVPPLALLVGVHLPGSVLLYGAAGYLTGAFVAALVGPDGPGARGAVLEPRELRLYLPRVAARGPWIIAGTSIGATVVGLVDAHIGPASKRVFLTAQPGVRTGALVVALLAAAATAAATRTIVRRPQPAASTRAVALDDALRAQAVHTVTGAGLAVGALAAAACLAATAGAARSPVLYVAGAVAAAVALVTAVAAWGLRTAPWQVGRRHAP